MTVKIDWNSVKQQTLWSYEDLMKKLLSVLAYDFVQEHYDHTMKQAQAYAKKIRRGYLQNQGDMTVYIDSIVTHLETLETRRIGTYSKLVHQVATREQCVAFLQRTDFDFDQLIQTLNYLFRWVLPFKTPLRELIDADSEVDVNVSGGAEKTEDRIESGSPGSRSDRNRKSPARRRYWNTSRVCHRPGAQGGHFAPGVCAW